MTATENKEQSQEDKPRRLVEEVARAKGGNENEYLDKIKTDPITQKIAEFMMEEYNKKSEEHNKEYNDLLNKFKDFCNVVAEHINKCNEATKGVRE